MWKSTFLQAAIPASRGPAAHIEQPDDFAMTRFNPDTGEVEAIFTPQKTLQRIHEVLHARHSHPNMDEAYPRSMTMVSEIVEDCRLHLCHWPWPVRAGGTPQAIREDVLRYMRQELANASENLSPSNPDHTFPAFATQLRAAAVYEGIGSSAVDKLFRNPAERNFARQMLGYIRGGKHALASYLIQRTFFEKEDEQKYNPKKVSPGGDGEDRTEQELRLMEIEEMFNRECICKMETVELRWTEHTINPMDGYRLATSGTRIYRPALRRPTLPQRLFIKRTPMEPAGAILFDASGSMGVNNEVLLDCCRRAPTATVAFYSGNDNPPPQIGGWLYVFAKDGLRATDIDQCVIPGGNSVDGAALDWLMQQEGPKIFVTDRQFCGSADSLMQTARLQRLEEVGLVTVYLGYRQFRNAHSISKEAA